MNASSPMEQAAYAANAEFDGNHWWFLGRNATVRAVARRFLGPLESADVLDFGCGTGGVSQQLQPSFKSYTCFEPSTEGSTICRSRGLSVYTKLEDARGAHGEGFDLTLCLDVIEHVEDDAALLRELFSQLKPSGFGLVTVPAYEWLWGAEDVISRHLRRYTRKSLAAAFERADLELVYLSGFNTFLLPLQTAVILLARNLHPKRTMTGQHTNLSRPSRLQQTLCLAVLELEAWLLQRVSLPIGGSFIAVARPRSPGLNQQLR